MEEIEKIRLDDVGTVFRIRIVDDDTPVDISACTVKKILFEKPDGTDVEEDATFYTDGTDGYIEYTSVEGDLNQAGLWKIQAYIEFASQSWHTTIDSFLVSENL